MDRLWFRLVDATTGEVLHQEEVTGDDNVEQMGVRTHEQALALGRPWRMEVQDPDGLIYPASRWTPVAEGP